MRSPVSIYIAHHPECVEAPTLTAHLFKWFRQGYSSAAIPVYFRRTINSASTRGSTRKAANKSKTFHPKIDYSAADLNVIVLLVDEKMVLDQDWRTAAIELSEQVAKHRNRSILLPVALHPSFYRTGPLYEEFNPIRLFHLNSTEDKISTLRRAVTEAIARSMRNTRKGASPPLDIFLSHAKADGNDIAVKLRDEVRNFSQMEAWYDANDLPFGAAWNSPMKEAAEKGTAAMISIVTDVYPQRPWCRQEVTLARTPQPLPKNNRVWKVQPVVAVHRPKDVWSNSLPMLGGVARIGWLNEHESNLTQQILDRLVLEVLFSLVHQKIAVELSRMHPMRGSIYITWTPDMWTLTALHAQLRTRASAVKTILYPGYGLSTVEQVEQKMIVKLFSEETTLISYEEAFNKPVGQS